jgi:hypothetical protein
MKTIAPESSDSQALPFVDRFCILEDVMTLIALREALAWRLPKTDGTASIIRSAAGN